ncbi:MAG: hypothetical protein HY747_02715 [Elusimicrobia bacterium]|nr:hypothetical protein [Elusimicrobiota bacterium]
MKRLRLSKKFIRLCKNVTAKRPGTVIDHILKHGFITTAHRSDLAGFERKTGKTVRPMIVPVQLK